MKRKGIIIIKRILAYLIDNVILVMLFVPLSVKFLDIEQGMHYIMMLYPTVVAMDPMGIILLIIAIIRKASSEIDVLFCYSLCITYFTILEYFFRRSIGKAAMGLVVESNEKITLVRILIRSFVRYISSILLIYMLFDKEGLGIHDKVSKTRVVEIK